MSRLVAGHLVTADHEEALETLYLHFGLGEEDKGRLNRNGVQERFVQALVLYDLSRGVVSQRQHFDGDELPFRFKGSETLLWLFQGVRYRTTETGGAWRLLGRPATGVGDRLGVGVRSARRRRRLSDTGILGVTTGHIYFAGSEPPFSDPPRPHRHGEGLARMESA